MTTVVSSNALHWKGTCLYFRGKIVGRIAADETYTGMWRVIRTDGSLSDMANLTRARDAALAQALRDLNHKETPSEAPPMSQNEAA